MTIGVSEREVLRGKRILFVSAGYEGKRFIYEKAYELGIEITLVDSADSWSRQLVSEGIVSNYIAVDFGQSPDQVVADILAGLRCERIEVDGVCTFAEMSLLVSSKLAECLGLPGSSPEVMALARDKHQLRKLVGDVRSYFIGSESDLAAAAEYVGFPSVLKPVSGADSLGVKKVANMLELESALQEVKQVVGGLVVSSGALCRTPSPVINNVNQLASRFIKLDLSLEEYLDGPEVDVDLVLYRGKCYFGAVVDNGPTSEPFFAETWNLSPSLLSREIQVELVNEAIRTVLAVGFTDGVFHVEERYTSKRGARIIEVNARMGGGPIRLMHKYLYGVDLVVEQIFSALGLPPSVCMQDLPPIPLAENNKCVASATPNAPRTGCLKSTAFLDAKIKSLPNLLGLWEFVQPGTPLVGIQQGQPSWLCELAITGSNGSQALLEQLTEITADLIADVENNYYL